MISKLAFLCLPFLACALPARDIAEGPFQPAWQSLQAGYQCPAWFRNAKFGIWAHWGPQCQPEEGDWYAKNMYEQFRPHHKYNLEHYGHPSKFGFKDICNIWKAENWDPGKLVRLYKQAGARYFVAMANHHDNFDNWDSKYQPWNSVNIGPKKDLIAGWEKAARAEGLHFGVTVHAARAWSWYEVAQGADKDGPLAGIPYDGNITKADGKGTWWEGLDPQDLYAQNHKLREKPSAAYVDRFFLRTKDLLDKYHPDLIYFDDTRLPLEEAGLNLAAHFYNANLRWNAGKLSAVINAKKLKPDERQGIVEDYERGVSEDIKPHPWQTDTCLGQWHYNKSIFQRHGYKSAVKVQQLLCDVVSKNGNLLLSVPVKSDGTIDSDEEKILKELGAWFAIHGEGIFDTRPWKIYGEKSPEAEAQGPGVDERKIVYTSRDIRFTAKGENLLYAFFLAWPSDGALSIRSLPKTGKSLVIKSVKLLGSNASPKWTQDAAGLHVQLPSNSPGNGVGALKLMLN